MGSLSVKAAVGEVFSEIDPVSRENLNSQFPE
jgi:hypothetical protein